MPLNSAAARWTGDDEKARDAMAVGRYIALPTDDADTLARAARSSVLFVIVENDDLRAACVDLEAMELF